MQCTSVVFFAVLFWSFLFILVSKTVSLKINEKNLWDFRNRIVSLVHAFYCIWFSTTEIISGTKFGSLNTSFQETVLSISLGYFIYDTLCMYKYGIYDKSIMLHHCLVLCGVSTGIITGRGGIEMIYGYFYTEFTNPCLQTKESLKAIGQKNTRSYLYMEVTFIIGYFFSRFVVGIPVVYFVLKSEDVIIYERLVALFLELMFFYWFKNMIAILRRRYRQYKERKQIGVELPWFVGFEKRE